MTTLPPDNSSPLYKIRCLLAERIGTASGEPLPYYVLAAHAGISPGTVSKLERDPRDCTVGSFYALVGGINKLGLPVTAEMLLGLEPLPKFGIGLLPIVLDNSAEDPVE